MNSSDTRFEGSIPAIYDGILGALLFEPYAEDIAARVRAAAPDALLETAAGTGVVTRALARLLPPGVRIVATDLNEAMLKVAANHVGAPPVTWQAADALKLPFKDAEFDAVVCQFGAMFFPDKVAGFREARRVLRPSGRFFFNVWDRLERNPLSLAVSDAVGALFPDDPPRFYHRVPFGWNDPEEIRRELRAAGFADITVDVVERTAHVPSAAVAAEGLCKGTPLRNEIEARAPGRLDAIATSVGEALTERFGAHGFEHRMSALVVAATVGQRA
jgi:ubiquinone/menaquinone biosynthesis C-methylase UbiE